MRETGNEQGPLLGQNLPEMKYHLCVIVSHTHNLPLTVKEIISAKNDLESCCFNMNTTIEDKIFEDEKQKINDKC